MRVSRSETTMNYVLLGAFALFALAPVITILATSVSATLGESGGLHLSNFVEAWTIATSCGELDSEAIVHDALTPWIRLPKLDAKLAIHTARKIGKLSGDGGIGGSGADWGAGGVSAVIVAIAL